MLQSLLTFGAGVATVASPCILPMLPLILGVSLVRSSALDAGPAATWSQGLRQIGVRPLLIVLGFVLAFAAAALLFGATTRVLGLSPQSLRSFSALVLAGFGLMMAWPGLGRRLGSWLPSAGTSLAGWGQSLGDRAGAGPGGALLLGASLGLVWTPCAGPVLASVLAVLASEPAQGRAAGLLLLYALGAGIPMLLIAYGGQLFMDRWAGLKRQAEALRRVFGLLMVLSAAGIHWQLDTQLTAWLADRLSWQQAGQLDRTGPAHAPELVSVDRWFNSPPLRLAQLKGKVVLLDFWTFACVNCVRTLPKLQAWHQRYAHQGLVVIGLHTPEFAFEKDPAELQAAIQRHGLSYPVAQDNEYRNWRNWQVQAWPTLVLLDRDGRVQLRHVGEGDEALIEAEIQQLLARPKSAAQDSASPADPARP